MSSLTHRSLTAQDLEQIAGIASKTAGSPRKAFFEKRLAQATAFPESFITCAVELDNKLVGYGFARVQNGDFGSNKPMVVLDDFGVVSEARGAGVGKTIIAGLELRAKKRGITILKTQVRWSDQALIGLFSSAGFKLAASYIIERDTSVLTEYVAEVASIKMDSKWQVQSSPGGNDYDLLARDRVYIRSFKREDLPAIIRIDSKLSGRERSEYYETKSREVLDESGIRVSLVAEEDGHVTGFIMARVDFGEFGKLDPEAIIDAIGVHPAYAGTGVGRALLSQLLLNLSTLKIESVSTLVSWTNFDLQRFLNRYGFAPSQRLVLSKDLGTV